MLTTMLPLQEFIAAVVQAIHSAWNIVSALQAWLSSQWFTPCYTVHPLLCCLYICPLFHLRKHPPSWSSRLTSCFHLGLVFSQSQPVLSSTSQQGGWTLLVPSFLKTFAMPVALQSTATSLSTPPRNLVNVISSLCSTGWPGSPSLPSFQEQFVEWGGGGGGGGGGGEGGAGFYQITAKSVPQIVCFSTLAFFGFLCSAEFTVPSLVSFCSSGHLGVRSIKVDNATSGIKASKTEPFCGGCLVHIVLGSPPLCAVQSMMLYCI